MVFAVYAVAVLASLLTFGRLSDHVGRRPVLSVAIAVQMTSLVVFVFADGVPMLLAARLVQGLAAGAATGAVGAAMLDINRARGTLANAIAPGIGTGSGALLSALLIQFLPAPTRLVYVVLLVILVIQAIAVALMPETVTPTAGARRSLRPEIKLPRAVRGPVLVLVSVMASSIPGFFVGLALGGIGFGGGFQGSLKTVIPLVEAHERAGVLSVLYVVCYVGFGLPTVIAGFLVVHAGGVPRTADEYSVAVILLALVALLGMRRATKTAPG